MTDRRTLRASIIINNHNYARYLRVCIESALKQTWSGTEVIVVDDGSTDQSRQIIDEFGACVVRVFRDNGGQAAAFNSGFSASRGTMVCFLDADDSLEPTAVQRALERFTDASIVNVHWPLWTIDDSGLRTGAVVPPGPLAEGDLRALTIEQGPDSHQGVPSSGNAWSSAFLEKVLPAPEPPYRHGADGYLITLAPLFGKIGRLPEPQGCYRIHSTNQFWKRTTDARVRGSLDRYERRSETLATYLRQGGISIDTDRWKVNNAYHRWLVRLDQALSELKTIVAPQAHFILVDQDEWGSDPVEDRHAIPFTERDGRYWGPPADDEAAIREFERLCDLDPTHLVFGWPAHWWLEHYSGLRQHLEARYSRVVADDRLIVFDLRAPGERRGLPPKAAPA